MPAVSPDQIVSAIQRAFEASGASSVLVSQKRAHPRCFIVKSDRITLTVWIYIWTLTHGGGARSRDEYRIQMTSVGPPLHRNPDGPTLLLGYEPNLECFAGFDLEMHRVFSTKSPSIQVDINGLRASINSGFAFVLKGNNEITVCFRPDNILAYCLAYKVLHEYGADADVSKILVNVGGVERFSETDLAAVPEERRRVVTQVARLARDADFRRKVIVAYDRKCCVSGLQLNLIDAAHILPVGAEGSTDEVANGLCLSPTYHRAFDRGLIYLNEDRCMLINRKRRSELIKLALAGGLEEFERCLGREILLPPDSQQWPGRSFISAANRLVRF